MILKARIIKTAISDMDSMCIYTLKGGKGIGETAVDEIEIGHIHTAN